MNKIKEVFSFKIPSLLIIALPYLSFHWSDIYNSEYYSNVELLILFGLLLLIQFLFVLFYNSKNAFSRLLSIFILASTITTIYGVNIVDLVFRWEMKHLHHQSFRNRLVFLLCYLLIYLLELMIYKSKKRLFFIQNVFFITLFVVTSFSSFYQFQKEMDIMSYKNGYRAICQNDSTNKPIILIIADEYSSPIELANNFKDASVFDFSNNLIKKGWKIKPSFYSAETSTIHSLSSIFNFNLSVDPKYASIKINKIGSNELVKATLADSLTKKNVSIINYGVFDFGKSSPLTRLYFYPKNFFEQLISFTAYPMMFYNSGGLKLNGFKANYFPWEEHNKRIINSLDDTVNSIHTEKSFIYVHLYMPHTPMVYSPEFKFRVETPENYLAFWKFTNSKLEALLKNLIKENKYRIIVTGDHGYRHNSKINPNKTFAAFYGFSETDLKSIPSVQDLGSLINGYLK